VDETQIHSLNRMQGFLKIKQVVHVQSLLFARLQLDVDIHTVNKDMSRCPKTFDINTLDCLKVTHQLMHFQYNNILV